MLVLSDSIDICDDHVVMSLIFKGAARGLYSKDHASRDFPLIFRMEYSVYSIGTVLIFLTGAIIQVT